MQTFKLVNSFIMQKFKLLNSYKTPFQNKI